MVENGYSKKKASTREGIFKTLNHLLGSVPRSFLVAGPPNQYFHPVDLFTRPGGNRGGISMSAWFFFKTTPHKMGQLTFQNEGLSQYRFEME